jgi:hypothetical protein
MVKTLLIIVEGTKDYFSLFSDVKTIQYQNERGETVEEELKVDQVPHLVVPSLTFCKRQSGKTYICARTQTLES